MSTITVNQRSFTESLMLAIVASDEQRSQKAVKLASHYAESLSEKEQDLCKMGIEVCMEYMEKYG